MSAFQFPDPAFEQTVTNPSTGSTYEWKADPGKWVLVTSAGEFQISQSKLHIKYRQIRFYDLVTLQLSW